MSNINTLSMRLNNTNRIGDLSFNMFLIEIQLLNNLPMIITAEQFPEESSADIGHQGM